MSSLASKVEPQGEKNRLGPPHGSENGLRLRALFDGQFDFVWRSLRRLGLSNDAADDAAQQVFLVLSRKLSTVAEGREQAFLFGTAMRIAADVRRSSIRRHEIPYESPGDDTADPTPNSEDLLDHKRARIALDSALDTLTPDLRAVFVLYELEGMTAAEIASTLEIPHGTVASRLRRARVAFREAAAAWNGATCVAEVVHE